MQGLQSSQHTLEAVGSFWHVSMSSCRGGMRHGLLEIVSLQHGSHLHLQDKSSSSYAITISSILGRARNKCAAGCYSAFLALTAIHHGAASSSTAKAGKSCKCSHLPLV